MRLKWEPLLAMAALLALGLWLVWGPRPGPTSVELRDGAWTAEVRMAQTRAVLEVVRETDGAGHTFRIIPRDGEPSSVFGEETFGEVFGPALLAHVTDRRTNWVFRLLNITSWTSVIWIAVGFAGQGAFFGRMLIQWLVSEKQRRSVVPEVFWWLSLAGGVALFSYFAWRQDIVGVLGQTTGLVIYARNIRLIIKHRRRARAGAGAGTHREAPADAG